MTTAEGPEHSSRIAKCLLTACSPRLGQDSSLGSSPAPPCRCPLGSDSRGRPCQQRRGRGLRFGQFACHSLGLQGRSHFHAALPLRRGSASKTPSEATARPALALPTIGPRRCHVRNGRRRLRPAALPEGSSHEQSCLERPLPTSSPLIAGWGAARSTLHRRTPSPPHTPTCLPV